MWIAKKGAGRNVQQKESGWVRAESAKHGEQYVVGSCEYRRLQRCAPYGIYTKPPKGTPVLVLGSQGGEVCLGAVSDPSAEEELLQEGEILIRSAGGASIRLCRDGRLLLNGREWGWRFCYSTEITAATGRAFCRRWTAHSSWYSGRWYV